MSKRILYLFFWIDELLDIVLECCIKYKGDAKYIVFKSLDSEKQTILQIIFPSNNNIVDNKKYDSFEEKYRVAYGMKMHNIYDITRNKNDLIIIVSKWKTVWKRFFNSFLYWKNRAITFYIHSKSFC